MKDTPTDTGAEANPDAGPMYVTEDIWVRQNPISGYQPYPYVADPAWLTAVSPLHQNPEYRDPKYSRPNYLYVRVRNRGSTASAGTERLRVYWAKASTGLSWPSQWVDYLAANCGPTKLYGIEITKPRRNAADTSVPQADLDEYRDAIVAIGTLGTYQFPDAVSYWHKQQTVHSHVVTYTQPSFAAHGNDGFLPWHREFLSRYEILLREAKPKVTLFYWDWTTDPRLSARITGLMGSFSGTIGAPFNVLAPPTVSRFTGTYSGPPAVPTPTSTTDATVTAPGTFSGHSSANETPHNRSHVYVGGNSGTLTSPSTSARDPFFFLLHGNADRLGAMWQRKNTSRYDPATVYSGTSATMTEPMAPWNGLRYNGSAASLGNPINSISPWTAADGYITLKRADDHSVVFPPIYDTSPLTIPVLQPGETVVIEIPWYPPNPADFSCFGDDQGHVCLLARIETSTTGSFGMTFAEGANVDTNVRNNNNIVWKNVTVQDFWPGPFMLAPIWLRNISLRDIVATRLALRIPPGYEDIFRFGTVLLDLKPELYDRWLQNGAVGQGFERVGQTGLQLLTTDAFVGNIPLLPDEVQQIEVQFRLQKNYADPQGRAFYVDLEQFATVPSKPDERIGGQRFVFDFNKLTLVRKHAPWRYVDDGNYPGDGWQKLDYDDMKWRSAKAPLGYGADVATTINGGERTPHPITAWFRHGFNLDDPSLYRSLLLRLKADDGAVVYLNGLEIHRARLPLGEPITPTTKASVDVEGAAEEVYSAVDVSNFLPLLRQGSNVLAVEVHQVSSDSPDLCFDAELCANLGSRHFPPHVVFTAPTDGSLHLLGRPIELSADAADPDGLVRAVAYFLDDQIIGVSQQPPYKVTLDNARPGQYQIIARAVDDEGNVGEAYLTVQVLDNLPPLVAITKPDNDSMFASTDQIMIMADASDIGGSIRQVDFYRKEHMHSFNEPEVLIGSSSTTPYMVETSNLAPGHYFLYADATDDQGVTTRSGVVMIEVMDNTLRLSIQFMDGQIMIARPAGSILQQADTPTGKWEDVPNAPNPTMIVPMGTAKFFRAYFATQ